MTNPSELAERYAEEQWGHSASVPTAIHQVTCNLNKAISKQDFLAGFEAALKVIKEDCCKEKPTIGKN